MTRILRRALATIAVAISAVAFAGAIAPAVQADAYLVQASNTVYNGATSYYRAKWPSAVQINARVVSAYRLQDMPYWQARVTFAARYYHPKGDFHDISIGRVVDSGVPKIWWDRNRWCPRGATGNEPNVCVYVTV
jgi:hypothetical protein